MKALWISLVALGAVYAARLLGEAGTLDPGVAVVPGGSGGWAERIKFRDVTKAAGIEFRHKTFVVDPKIKPAAEWLQARGSAVVVGDFDGDGFQDFYATSSADGSRNGLFRNKGDGTFVDVAEAYGVADLNRDGFNSMSAVFFDYDNDGRLDLYVVGMGCNKLFHNEGGKRFSDVTAKAGQVKGIPDEHGMCGSPSSVLAFDYNRDGKLDLFVSNNFEKDRRKVYDDDTHLVDPLPSKLKGGPKAYLMRNNGDGTFTEVAEELGVAGYSWAVAAGAADFNNDGWPDLFVANDQSPDRLFLNQEGKRFEEVSRDAFPGQYGRVGMSAELVDLDGDGLPEVYSTKITRQGYMNGNNELWQNLDGRHGRNVARERNVASCGWSWNAKFFDIAHRGLQDLVVVNGMYSGDPKRSYWFPFNTMRAMDNHFVTDAKWYPPMKGADLSGYEKNCLFLNTGTGFLDVAVSAGITDTYDGRGVATIDLRNDGRQSLLIGNSSGPVLLYENASQMGQNEWIGFDLRVSRDGRDAVGARVRVTTDLGGATSGGEKNQYLEVFAGNGYAAQSDPRLVFGLGENAKVKAVEIRWPDGRLQTVTDFRKNAYNRIYEPR